LIGEFHTAPDVLDIKGRFALLKRLQEPAFVLKWILKVCGGVYGMTGN
jgi:hypothetical protein